MNALKRLPLAMALLLVGVACVIAQEMPTRSRLFDENWRFLLGDPPSAGASTFDDRSWRTLDLPHDWSIEGKFSPHNPTGGGGGYLPAGVGWYRKTFAVPASWAGKRVSIYFEGVYMNAEVFLNGKSLGVHPYGYTGFCYDLTPLVDFGKDNVIAVRVDNAQQMNSRWYSGSGIYRHVWLRVTNAVHIGFWGVGITTPEVSPEVATVKIHTILKNESDATQSIVLNTQLRDANAISGGEDRVRVDLGARTEKTVEQTITPLRPSLWTPQSPHLYRANVQVLRDGNVIDETRTTFGVRSIACSVENGFQLNGKTVKLNGGCVHHDNGCLGAAAFDRAEERRVEILMAAGFNTIRTSHNPPSEAFLDACDRLGIMVIDESFDCWKEHKNPYDYASVFDSWWERDIDAMVLRDRNHPSVVMWSIGNEIIERKKPEAIETARLLAQRVHGIDRTRPVTSAMTTWDKEWEMFDSLFAAHDIAGYNYQLFRAPSDHERVPSRIIIQTESFPRDAFANWKMVQGNSYIIGDVVWTALDYLGESGIGRSYYSGEVTGEPWETEMFPWHAASCGDIDLIGHRKPISHYRNMLYNESEKLFMAVREPDPEPLEIKETKWSVWPTWECWTWPGYEGKDLQVEVNSKYPNVRLYLNTKLVGEQATSEAQQFKATFHVPYASGVLTAAGVEGNKEVERTTLRTANQAATISLLPDRRTITADGQDLSFVEIEVKDKNGTLQPNAQDRLQFSITGPGVLAGVGNADTKDADQYVGTTRRVWHGRALVVIRSTKHAGSIKFTASSSGLPDAHVTIIAEAKEKP